ncbi:hypothetical protein ACWGDS_23070 [Streptomyces sp. NPDC055059]|jgi:hypothetical protein|uniref:Uncharacterized protein n=1 Tax=Streptomyces sp. NBC_00119 TaxID=2975659 RepID=A0AAU1U7J0_9ACTN|nr:MULTISPECIES: hypothetical protein [unclassified Streptomyces]MCX4644005.1 hypothetical protein [Streptomyces sp. NBC_01446]MCX5325117.1 hypothetical protein [Streptomyces sp. NBC_00120]
MSINQQYALDVYRASLHGEPAPPAPGVHDWGAIRELRDYRRFRAVIDGRPAHGRIRAALARLIHPHRRAAGC